tara:strand:- start:45206 stop:45724 length:519 start_codon:yes stop_codon:yes gene_type:complete
VRIVILETGGTINGILDPADPPPIESRVVAWLQEQAQSLDLQLEATIVMMKDSRAIEDADRAALAAAIESLQADRILISHGTYTMPATGSYLRQHLSPRAQRGSIVLVGSMIPLGEAGSDAPTALEFAVRSLQQQPVGVWIAMQQQLWHPDKVVKDSVSGKYIEHHQAQLQQ